MKRDMFKRLLAGILMTAFCLGAVVVGSTKKTVLTIGIVAGSYWDAPNNNCYKIMDDAIERFEQQHPNVSIEYTSGILKRDYAEWLGDQYLLGKEPDVFIVLPEDFGMLCQLDALEPLDAFIEQDDTVSRAAFYDAALASGMENARQYALPYECVPTLMFVNKTLLEQEGISVPENNWTWDDFYHICAQVTRDIDGDGTFDQFGSYGYSWRDALISNGAALFSDDGMYCQLGEPQAVEAIAFEQKLEKLYQGCDITSISFDEGKVAFRPFLFSDYRTYQPYPWRIKKYSDFAWDCIQMPRGPSGGNSSELSTLMMGIGSRSHHKRLAWEFLKEMTCSEQTQKMLFTDSHGVSALRRVTQSEQTQEILRQDTPGDSQLGLEILPDAMEQAIAAPHFQQYDQALALANGLIETAMQDENNLELQLLRAQREIDQYLQN
ncbi:MAG: extracellular solute-binding protein [Eubacteriales bacterium]|nr:extracellular solute-binding protein [Eubacteriales bacterium]